VSGKIVEVNIRLADNPELINESPYEDGWIAKIELSDEKELDNLMDSDEYRRYIESLEEEGEA
jgi:glycine cleavage system H protein